MKPRRFNFDSLKPPDDDSPPPFIPPGTYTVEISGVVEKESSRGHDYYQWTLIPVSPKVHPEFKLYFITLCEGPGFWAMPPFLEALGFEKEDLDNDFLFFPDMQLGKRIKVEVSVATYLDKKHNRVGEPRRVT